MFGKSWNFYWVMFTNVFHSYGQLPEGKGEYKSSNLMVATCGKYTGKVWGSK